MDEDDGHAIADHLDVRGTVLHRRFRDFSRDAVMLGRFNCATWRHRWPPSSLRRHINATARSFGVHSRGGIHVALKYRHSVLPGQRSLRR